MADKDVVKVEAKPVDLPPYHTAETFRIAQEREAAQGKKVDDGKAK